MKPALPSRRLSAGLLLTAGLLWLAWPLLRPRLWPAAGGPWLVVLDGYHRIDAALKRQQRTAEPILLITCPSTGQPTAAQWERHRQISQRLSPSPQLVVLVQGFDTATQAAALARWLQERRRQGQTIPGRLHLVSDPHHFPRAQWAAQIATGGLGTDVLSLPVADGAAFPGVASPAADWLSWRDALRLQLWRATGSTGAVLEPHTRDRKIRACRANP